jgi:hypothetical protein
LARDELIIDWRSTGRRKARRALFNARVDFCCVDCGKTTKVPPKDAPVFFDEIWPYERRVLNGQSLQADHESKDVTNNNIEDLNWRCASCHKKQDMKTEKGVSTIENDITSYL